MADSFAEELIDELATEGIVTAKGTDAFYNQLPMGKDITPATFVMLQEIQGPAPTMGNPSAEYNIGYEVWSSTNFTTARRLAGRIHSYFHQMRDKTLGNSIVIIARANNTPGSLGENRDSKHRWGVGGSITFEAYRSDQTGPDTGTGYDGFKDTSSDA